jgi:hypothetical protein
LQAVERIHMWAPSVDGVPQLMVTEKVDSVVPAGMAKVVAALAVCGQCRLAPAVLLISLRKPAYNAHSMPARADW